MNRLRAESRGFTLIEMMVVVAITGVIAVGGIASYTKFRDRTQVQSDANQVVARLRKIQTTASAVEAPSTGCSAKVTGFTVTLSGSNLTVVANCGATVTRNDLALTLGSSKFRRIYSIVFTSPQIGATPLTVYICNSSVNYQFTINALGGISAPTLYVGPPLPGNCP